MEWADVRRLIAQIVGPRVAAHGFVNPGRAMWRFRPAAVEVVWFECRRPPRFRLEFARGVRSLVPNNPAPWDCPVRVTPAHMFGWPDEWWVFRESAAEQAAVLGEMAPVVAAAAEVWFARATVGVDAEPGAAADGGGTTASPGS